MSKSLCIFVHYGRRWRIPYYVELFLGELTPFFDEVILATNRRPLLLPELGKVQVKKHKNEGYDFGMFYKTLKSLDLSKYHRIALINDSNLIFASLAPVFEWGLACERDCWGITDNHDLTPQYEPGKSYHVQSHFLVFEQRAIPLVNQYFDEIKFEAIFGARLPQRALRQRIIAECEIGLSQYLLDQGLTLGAQFGCDRFVPRVSDCDPLRTNMHIWLWRELIEYGYPLIKKKIVAQGFAPEDKVPDFEGWQEVVRQHTRPDWKFDRIIAM